MSSSPTGRPSTGTSSATVECSSSSSCCDELLGNLGLDRADLELVQSGSSGFACTATVAVNSQSCVVGGRELEVVLGLRDGAQLDRAAAFQNQPPMWLSIASAIEPLPADLLHEHLARHLSLAEAGDLDALGEVGRRVLDRVVDVVRRHLHRESDAILGELLDLGLHPAIQADPFLGSVAYARAPCVSSSSPATPTRR